MANRDPERIEAILDRLRYYWLQKPQLRLCQIVGNITGKSDPYYVEDEEFLKELNWFIAGKPFRAPKPPYPSSPPPGVFEFEDES